MASTTASSQIWASNLNGYGQHPMPVVSLPAASNTTLTANQSGQVFLLPQATANNTITLPAVQVGLKFKFICSATANGSNTQTIASATAGQINGFIIGASVVNKAAANSVVLSATAANVKAGDRVEFTSDGSVWFVEAFSSGTANGWS